MENEIALANGAERATLEGVASLTVSRNPKRVEGQIICPFYEARLDLTTLKEAITSGKSVLQLGLAVAVALLVGHLLIRPLVRGSNPVLF